MPAETRDFLVLAAILFAAVLWTFSTAIHNDFVGYDDPEYVTGNGHVQQGLTLDNVRWAFTASAAGNWHPLTWLSHMLDCQLFGLSPSKHHFVSVLLHALNAVILFFGLLNFTRAKWRGFIVAGLFALHPLRVESVAWISERKDVLSGFFFLLTVLAYGKYVSNVSVSGSNGGIRLNAENGISWYVLALLLFALGLMSKPMLVTLPFVLLLLDYWPLNRFALKSGEATKSIIIKLLVEKIPFFALSAICSLVTFVVQRNQGAMSLAVPLFVRIENAMVSYCRYIGKTFVPANLAFFYPYEPKFAAFTIALALLFLVAITGVAIVWRYQRKFLLVGWLWYIGTLVPVIGLVQVGEQAFADRYTYIPSIGLFLALVWCVQDMTNRWKSQASFFASLTGAIGLICVVLSWDQAKIWRNNETLFTHAIAVTRNNYVAHNNLGTTYDQQGRLEEALTEFRLAIAEKPDDARAHKNLAVVLERKGDSNNALEEYRTAIRLNPNLAEAHNAFGAFFNAHGRPDEAIAEFQQALKLKTDYADAHFNLGVVYGRKGMIDAAVREYQAALEVEPNRAEAHNNLGVLYDGQGRVDNATSEYVQAILIDGRYARARFNLGVALTHKGAIGPAIEQFQETLKLKPDYAEARTNLNMLLEMRENR